MQAAEVKAISAWDGVEQPRRPVGMGREGRMTLARSNAKKQINYRKNSRYDDVDDGTIDFARLLGHAGDHQPFELRGGDLNFARILLENRVPRHSYKRRRR